MKNRYPGYRFKNIFSISFILDLIVFLQDSFTVFKNATGLVNLPPHQIPSTQTASMTFLSTRYCEPAGQFSAIVPGFNS